MFLHNFIVLVVTDLTISTRLGVYFVSSCWYLKKVVTRIKFDTVLIQQFNKIINGEIQTNKDQKSNLLFLQ